MKTLISSLQTLNQSQHYQFNQQMLFVQQPQYCSSSCSSVPELLLFNQPHQRLSPKRSITRRQLEQQSPTTVRTLEDEDSYYLVLAKSRPAPSFFYYDGHNGLNVQPFDSYEFKIDEGKLFVRSLQENFYKAFELPEDVDLSDDFKIEFDKSGYTLIVTIKKEKAPTADLVDFFSLFAPTCQIGSSDTIQERRALAQASQSRKQEIERKRQEAINLEKRRQELERQKQEAIELERRRKQQEQQLRLEQERQRVLAEKRQRMFEIREKQKKFREQELQKQYQLQKQLEEQQREVSNKISNLIRIGIQDAPVVSKNTESTTTPPSSDVTPADLLSKDIESDPELSDASSTTQEAEEIGHSSSDDGSISDEEASLMLRNYQTSTRKTHFPPLESELEKEAAQEEGYDYVSDASSGMSTDSESSSDGKTKRLLRSPMVEDVEDEEFSN